MFWIKNLIAKYIYRVFPRTNLSISLSLPPHFFLSLSSKPTLKQIFSPSLKDTLRFSLQVLRLRLATIKFSPVSHSTITEDTCIANVQVIYLQVLLSSFFFKFGSFTGNFIISVFYKSFYSVLVSLT